MARALLLVLIVFCTAFGTGCSSSESPHAAVPDSMVVSEALYRPLKLAAPAGEPESELSGLAWDGSTLVLLPQYPSDDRAAGRGHLFGIAEADLATAVADSSHVLHPYRIEVQLPGESPHFPGYQGCEAILFSGDEVYVLVEAEREDGMHGHLLRGHVGERTVDAAPRAARSGPADAPRPQVLRIDSTQIADVPTQTRLPNMAYEALTLHGDTLIALYEANGAHVNPNAQALRFGRRLQPMAPLSFPTIEYRITDATSVDADGRFWVINYFFPGDRDTLTPAVDSLAERYGRGRTHRSEATVERLVEYQVTPHGIIRTDTPPLWLPLTPGEDRNWEGLVRYRDGFLLATDLYPRTILAYVERGNE